MRQEKQLLLDEVKEKLEKANGFIIAGYKSFTADRSREFRDRMVSLGGEFEVVKKRVFLKAADQCGIQFDLKDLKGHVGIIFANEDLTKIAKDAVQYSEENDNFIAVLGGKVEGEKCSGEDIEALAKLPSLTELRAQVLGLFEAPMAQTLSTIQAALTSVLYCLDEKSKKEER